MKNKIESGVAFVTEAEKRLCFIYSVCYFLVLIVVQFAALKILEYSVPIKYNVGRRIILRPKERNMMRPFLLIF